MLVNSKYRLVVFYYNVLLYFSDVKTSYSSIMSLSLSLSVAGSVFHSLLLSCSWCWVWVCDLFCALPHTRPTKVIMRKSLASHCEWFVSGVSHSRQHCLTVSLRSSTPQLLLQEKCSVQRMALSSWDLHCLCRSSVMAAIELTLF